MDTAGCHPACVLESPDDRTNYWKRRTGGIAERLSEGPAVVDGARGAAALYRLADGYLMEEILVPRGGITYILWFGCPERAWATFREFRTRVLMSIRWRAR